MENSINVDGYHLVCTCSACPEQYDVFKDNKQVGYLRLRHGSFTAHVPDYYGRIVYSSDHMKGDGCFYQDERSHYLKEAINSIHKHLNPTDKEDEQATQ